MLSPIGDSMFILPVCYHPTTVLTVDDDAAFSELLALRLSKQRAVLPFTKPEQALAYTENDYPYLPFTSRCMHNKSLNIEALRQECLQAHRFNEIVISVTDYDMPKVTGVQLMKTMVFPPEVAQYSHIILTGKVSDTFKAKLKEMGKQSDYINKDCPDYIQKLLEFIEERELKIFQWLSYVPARMLADDPNEKAVVLFDGDFAEVLNKQMEKQRTCEFYLFDRQGSLILLDEKASPSWCFVRNELGIQNSIQLANKYGAPAAVLSQLQSKKMILSLYEESDFKALSSIDWPKYLLPATRFESSKTFLHGFSNLLPDGDKPVRYYYAVTSEFPGYEVGGNSVLSYRAFLRGG